MSRLLVAMVVATMALGCATVASPRAERAFERGVEAQLAGDATAAQTAYDEAIAAGLRSSSAWNNLALLAASRHDFPTARLYLLRALATNEDDVVARANLGIVSFWLSDATAAKQALAAVDAAELERRCQIPSASRVQWLEERCRVESRQLASVARRYLDLIVATR